MSDRLSRFLHAASGRRFQYGTDDCLMWLADYVLALRGVDPAAEWRGRYRTPVGAARILQRRGGAVAHLDKCLATVGIGRTDSPRRGDIAIVDAPEGEAGAILLGAFSVCRGRDSLLFRRLPVLAAWRV